MVMMELGVRVGVRRPFLLMSSSAAEFFSPFLTTRRVIYEADGSLQPAVTQLAEQISEVLVTPEKWSDPWSGEAAGPPRRSSVFVSYSHADTEYVARLRVHLKSLERTGLVELWDDSRIAAGERWKDAIEAALTRAAAAVLIISADFLASEFIVTNELPPLLRAAEERGTTILPLIAKASRFLRDRNLAVFQAINDPARPLALLSSAEQEGIYARLAERIEAIVGPQVAGG